MPIPAIKYKRSNSIFFVTSVAFIYKRVWQKLLQPFAQSLIGNPCSLGGVGYFSKERGFSVGSSLQRNSSNFLLWDSARLLGE